MISPEHNFFNTILLNLFPGFSGIQARRQTLKLNPDLKSDTWRNPDVLQHNPP
jgi:hypothetical protein